MTTISGSRAASDVPESEQDLAARTTALVRTWLAAAAAEKPDASAARLAGVLRDPKGLAFTVGFVDGVVRPEDLRAAAKRLPRSPPTSRGSCPCP